jgi:uncharacterized protein (TIGR02246 family)
MNDIERLVVERACERVVIASATCNDARDWAGHAALYTPDGVVVRPNGQRLEGRAAIEAGYAAAPAERVTRHLCTNLRVEVASPDEAHVDTTVFIVSGVRSDEPDATFGVVPSARHLVGEFADRLVRTVEGWRIAERHARLVMNT